MRAHLGYWQTGAESRGNLERKTVLLEDGIKQYRRSIGNSCSLLVLSVLCATALHVYCS